MVAKWLVSFDTVTSNKILYSIWHLLNTQTNCRHKMGQHFEIQFDYKIKHSFILIESRVKVLQKYQQQHYIENMIWYQIKHR